MTELKPEHYMDLVKRALAEDIGSGDISTQCLNLGERRARAVLRAKDHGILAGRDVAAACFHELDPDVAIVFKAKDGEQVRDGAVIMEITGRAAALLGAERTALNFLQRLSGIAKYTYLMVQQTVGLKSEIYDTRKTTPGMRMLEKYAVRMGGGRNHRIGLFDQVLLKDNHILLAGGVAQAVQAAKTHLGAEAFVEVEVESMDQVRQALDAGADRIMLDNMSFTQVEEAMQLIDGRAEVEVSGGVTLITVGTIADMHVDVISVGALTHSADAMDISMDFQPE
jgi:nicotinate-nucleotide pyrophosphorylase (carboxylating)